LTVIQRPTVVICLFISGGIPNFLEDKSSYQYFPYAKAQREYLRNEEKTEEIPLTFPHIYPIMLLWTAFLLVGILTFACEVCQEKCEEYGNKAS